MSDRELELQLLAFAPYWRELLALWIGSIVLLALVQTTLKWLRKPKPGEFANLASFAPMLVMLGLPPAAGLFVAIHYLDDFGMLAVMAVFIGLPLASIYLASKLKMLLVWLFTGLGQYPRDPDPTPAKVTTSMGSQPLLDGKPVPPE